MAMLLATATLAHAEEESSSSSAPAAEEPSSSSGEPIRNRIASFRVSAISGVPDLFSLSASLTALRPFEIEAGVGTTLIQASTAYVRAGYAHTLSDERAQGGWTWHLLFLGGYRYSTSALDLRRSHGATANLGVDGTHWVSPNFGFHFHAVVGAALWLRQTSTTALVAPDVRIALGISL